MRLKKIKNLIEEQLKILKEQEGCNETLYLIIETSGYIGSLGSTSATTTIQYVPIAATGTASDFGDCSIIRNDAASCASPDRALCAAGVNGGSGKVRSVDYFAVGTTGTAGDFGDLTLRLEGQSSVNNGVYGIFAGGAEDSNVRTDNIEYVSIATLGDGQAFGDLTLANRGNDGCAA